MMRINKNLSVEACNAYWNAKVEVRDAKEKAYEELRRRTKRTRITDPDRLHDINDKVYRITVDDPAYMEFLLKRRAIFYSLGDTFNERIMGLPDAFPLRKKTIEQLEGYVADARYWGAEYDLDILFLQHHRLKLMRFALRETNRFLFGQQ